PSNPAVVYAATPYGVYISRNGGETWRAPERWILGNPLSVAVDPRNARHAWVGTSSGLIATLDLGATWGYAESDLTATVADVALDPVHPDTVYLITAGHEDGGETGILKSTDNGATWQIRNDGLDSGLFLVQENARLAIDPDNPSIVYAAFYTESGPREFSLFRSADGATTWQPAPAGYPVATGPNGVVYAGGFRSADHGQTWQPISQPPVWETPALDYTLTPAGMLLAGTDRLGVFRSPDQGQHWQEARKGLHATAVTSFVIDPERPRVIYAGASEAGVYKTQSGGAQWRLAENGLPAEVHYTSPRHQLAISLEDPASLYLYWSSVRGGGPGLAWTDDGAAQWEVRQHGSDFVYSPLLVADPTRPSTLYLAGSFVGPGSSPCGLSRSTDRGATFQCLAPFADRSLALFGQPLIADPAIPGRLWVLESSSRIWRSDDYGDHWTDVHPTGLANAGDPNSLTIDPAHAGRLYLGTRRNSINNRPERVWRSDDNGKSWRPWGTGMPESSQVDELLIDSRQPSIFYAVVNDVFDPVPPFTDLSGVYWSRNGGRTFYPLINGLPNRRVTHLELNPKDPRQLFVATPANGIYTFTRQ
ncbi:MAG TPA: hypothetical protein VHU81_05215, partial [Thermoanaerobaculia bacterium]|nr:hypothetical protein [Thermoanaerobaculia bacterium]